MRAGVFPGQGLAARDVLAALPERHPLVAQATEILGFDLRRAVHRAPRKAIPTRIAQPAILTAGIIAFEERVERGEIFDFLVGHSLGEYTALVAARSISFADGIRLVSTRGQAMEKAARMSPGGMAAVIGLSTQDVYALAERAGGTVANDNSPGQVVIAGNEAALANIATLARDLGGRCVLLQVDGAYHSPGMAPAEHALASALDHTSIRSPRIPVISNVSAAAYRAPGEIRRLLLQQLTTAVRFRESIEGLVALGVKEFVDLGPGHVAQGLVKATVSRPPVVVDA